MLYPELELRIRAGVFSNSAHGESRLVQVKLGESTSGTCTRGRPEGRAGDAPGGRRTDCARLGFGQAAPRPVHETGGGRPAFVQVAKGKHYKNQDN